MNEYRTTVIVQRYLDELKGHAHEASAAPVVRDLLSQAARRLEILCASMLHRGYRRLTRPPVNLRTEEMLSPVVERLIKALREARPRDVRQFFGLANQHMRWELNDLARRLDEQSRIVPMDEEVQAAEPSDPLLSKRACRILEAIDGLGEDEREVFGLVHMQGLTHAEAAAVVGVSTKTVERRLTRGILNLQDALRDLRIGRP